MKPNQIICGNNIDVVKPWPANCIDGIVTDAPYELGFMGKGWDSSGIAYNVKMWKQMLRITKPGGFLLCFGGTRTYHRLACAIEDAGWEIRDCMMWLYGSGFPKSHNISKAIDKAAGANRKVVGKSDSSRPNATQHTNTVGGNPHGNKGEVNLTIPATPLAQLWDGYGTALKPAWEPIIVAMKPLDGTFAHNAEAHGVAGLNIDGGRIGTENRTTSFMSKNSKDAFNRDDNWEPKKGKTECQGRWPANLILDEEARAMLDEQSGISKSTGGKNTPQYNRNLRMGRTSGQGTNAGGLGDSGGASRFFYCAKTSRKERNMGMEDSSGKKVNDGRQTPIDNPYQRGETIRKNTHPTVKPLALMKYLCTLLKMPSADQIILDPFLGSGTTGIACKELGINFIGIEKEREYCEIAVKRITTVEGPEVSLHTDNPSTNLVLSHHPECKQIKESDLYWTSGRIKNAEKEGIDWKHQKAWSDYPNPTMIWQCHPDCPMRKSDNSPAEVPKPKPANDEHRQNIINVASAALRRNRK